MSSEQKIRGICLAAQQIRQLLDEGRITAPHFSEHQIQPSSFEATLGDTVFVLDTEEKGIFRQNRRETVYHTLLDQIPARGRTKENMGGYELKKGYTYLLSLQERLRLHPEDSVVSSPKSSIGRVFLHTRMLADYASDYDYIDGINVPREPLQLWLLVQPLAFNVIVHPGISLNQLRFFRGRGALLTPDELEEEFQRQPLLYLKENHEPAVPEISDRGLALHLDLEGKSTAGIVGLRARHQPRPLDLRYELQCDAETYFEPLKAPDGKFTLRRKEYYLFASREVLSIPSHLNVELSDHSAQAFQGPLHFAGFADNGFQGDLVLEVRSDEQTDMTLHDGMPISFLKVFRTSPTHKVYGVSTQAHYQSQEGPRTAKYFRPFDFALAARHYQKLERTVLVHEAEALKKFRTQDEGFEFIDEEKAAALLREIETRGFFHSRHDCETDLLVLQPIPYVLLFGPGNTVFTYRRATDRRNYGEQRLFNKHSVGVGGHIIHSDGPHYVEGCIGREILEEVTVRKMVHGPHFVGTLFQNDRPVDRVHFGIIYAMLTDGNVFPKESSITEGSFQRFSVLEQIIAQKPDTYETWSKVLIPHLAALYSRH